MVSRLCSRSFSLACMHKLCPLHFSGSVWLTSTHSLSESKNTEATVDRRKKTFRSPLTSLLSSIPCVSLWKAGQKPCALGSLLMPSLSLPGRAQPVSDTIWASLYVWVYDASALSAAIWPTNSSTFQPHFPFWRVPVYFKHKVSATTVKLHVYSL